MVFPPSLFIAHTFSLRNRVSPFLVQTSTSRSLCPFGSAKVGPRGRDHCSGSYCAMKRSPFLAIRQREEEEGEPFLWIGKFSDNVMTKIHVYAARSLLVRREGGGLSRGRGRWLDDSRSQRPRWPRAWLPFAVPVTVTTYSALFLSFSLSRGVRKQSARNDDCEAMEMPDEYLIGTRGLPRTCVIYS